jgi:hypothetical protein
LACGGSRDPFVPDPAGLLDGVRRRATGAARVETRLLAGVDHGYVGREAAVAEALAAWLAGLA